MIWSAGSEGRIGESSTTELIFEGGTGKLVIVDTMNHSDILFDVAPSIPSRSNTDPASTSPCNDLVFVIADTAPHLVLASTMTGAVFWAPTGYQVSYDWSMQHGTSSGSAFICQTTEDRQHTLISMVNPHGKFAILKTISEPTLPSLSLPSWPLDHGVCEMVWKSHGEEGGPSCKIIFQGDGYLVSIQLHLDTVTVGGH